MAQVFFFYIYICLDDRACPVLWSSSSICRAERNPWYDTVTLVFGRTALYPSKLSVICDIADIGMEKNRLARSAANQTLLQCKSLCLACLTITNMHM